MVSKERIQNYAAANTSPKFPLEEKMVTAFMDALMNSTSLDQLFEKLKLYWENDSANITDNRFTPFENYWKNIQKFNQEPYKSIISYSMLKKDETLFKMIQKAVFGQEDIDIKYNPLMIDVDTDTTDTQFSTSDDETSDVTTDMAQTTDFPKGIPFVGFKNHFAYEDYEQIKSYNEKPEDVVKSNIKFSTDQLAGSELNDLILSINIDIGKLIVSYKDKIYIVSADHTDKIYSFEKDDLWTWTEYAVTSSLDTCEIVGLEVHDDLLYGIAHTTDSDSFTYILLTKTLSGFTAELTNPQIEFDNYTNLIAPCTNDGNMTLNCIEDSSVYTLQLNTSNVYGWIDSFYFRNLRYFVYDISSTGRHYYLLARESDFGKHLLVKYNDKYISFGQKEYVLFSEYDDKLWFLKDSDLYFTTDFIEMNKISEVGSVHDVLQFQDSLTVIRSVESGEKANLYKMTIGEGKKFTPIFAGNTNACTVYKGHIYVAKGNELYVSDDNKNFSKIESFLSENNIKLLFEYNGLLYAANDGKAYVSSNGQIFESLEGTGITSYCIIGNKLYVAKGNQVLYSTDGRNFNLKDTISSVSGAGDIYICTTNGKIYAAKSKEVYESTDDNDTPFTLIGTVKASEYDYINGMVAFKNNLYVFNTSVGLQQSSVTNVNFVKNESLLTKYSGGYNIQTLYATEDNLYVGTGNGGLQISSDGYTFGIVHDSNISSAIYSIYEYMKKLYVSTENYLYLSTTDSTFRCNFSPISSVDVTWLNKYNKSYSPRIHSLYNHNDSELYFSMKKITDLREPELDYVQASISGWSTTKITASVSFNGKIFIAAKLNTTPKGIKCSENGTNFEQVTSFPSTLGVNSFYKKSEGELYVCTDEGLYRSTDGVTFTQLDEEVFPHIKTYCMITVNSYPYWEYVGTEDGLYEKTNGVSYTQVADATFPQDEAALCIHVHLTELWNFIIVGTANGLYWKYNSSKFYETTLIDSQINTFYSYRDKIYAGTQTKGLYEIIFTSTYESMGINAVQNTSIGNNELIDSLFEYEGKLYVNKGQTINSQFGLYVSSNGETFDIDSAFPTSALIRTMCEFNQNFYLGTNINGLWISSQELFEDNYSLGIYDGSKVVRAGQLFGTDTSTSIQNLVLINDTLFASTEDISSLASSYQINSVCVYNNKIYVGTEDHGLFVSTDGEKFLQVSTLPKDYSVTAIYGTTVNSQNRIYVGTKYNGVWYTINYTTSFNHITTEESISGATITSIVKYEGNIYVGTEGKGLYKDLNGNYDMQHLSGINTAYTISCLYLHNSKLYIGTMEHGLWEYNNTTVSQNTGIPTDTSVRAIYYKTTGGIFYVATEHKYILNSIYHNDSEVYYSTDSGSTFVKLIDPGIPESSTLRAIGDLDGDLYIDYNLPGVPGSYYTNYFKSENNEIFNNINPTLDGTPVSYFKLTSMNNFTIDGTERLYVAIDTGVVAYSVNGKDFVSAWNNGSWITRKFYVFDDKLYNLVRNNNNGDGLLYTSDGTTTNGVLGLPSIGYKLFCDICEIDSKLALYLGYTNSNNSSTYGLYVSEDGETFAKSSSTGITSLLIKKVIVFNDEIYLGTSDGLYISSDFSHFTKLLVANVSDYNVCDMCIHDSKLCVSIQSANSSASGVWEFTDSTTYSRFSQSYMKMLFSYNNTLYGTNTLDRYQYYINNSWEYVEQLIGSSWSSITGTFSFIDSDNVLYIDGSANMVESTKNSQRFQHIKRNSTILLETCCEFNGKVYAGVNQSSDVRGLYVSKNKFSHNYNDGYIGTSSGIFGTIYDIRFIDDKLYVSHNGGESLSEDKGATFTTYYPTGWSYPVYTTYKFNDTIYYGGMQGLYAGSTHIDSIPSTRVYAICEFNDKLYVCTNSQGIYVSTDGTNFTQNTSFPMSGLSIVMNAVFVFDNKLYVGTWNGLYWSSDGNTFYSQPTFSSLKISSFGVFNERLYVGTNNGLYKSNADASSFSRITSVTSNVLSIWSYKGTLYLGTENGIWTSTDGTTFEQSDMISNTVSVSRIASCDAFNRLFASSSTALYESYPMNGEFIQVPLSSDLIINKLTVFNNKLYIGSDQGIYYTSDGTNIVQTDVTVSIEDIFVDSDTIYFSTSNNGLYKSTNGTTFTQITGGPIPYKYNPNCLCKYVSGNDETLYAGTYNGIYVSSDLQNFEHLSALSGININALFQSPTSNKLYAGTRPLDDESASYSSIYYSTNGTTFQVATIPDGITIIQFYENDGRLFATTDGHGLWYSDNGTTFHQFINDKLPSDVDARSMIAVTEGSDNVLYVGTHEKGVYKSPDGLSGFEQISDINDITNMVPYQSEILTGTDHGLFKTSDFIEFDIIRGVQKGYHSIPFNNILPTHKELLEMARANYLNELISITKPARVECLTFPTEYKFCQAESDVPYYLEPVGIDEVKFNGSIQTTLSTASWDTVKTKFGKLLYSKYSEYLNSEYVDELPFITQIRHSVRRLSETYAVFHYDIIVFNDESTLPKQRFRFVYDSTDSVNIECLGDFINTEQPNKSARMYTFDLVIHFGYSS